MEQAHTARKRKQPPTTADGTGPAPSVTGGSCSGTGNGAVVEKCQVLENGKRRVRKGTKSCWQCRRRKIKCEYQNTGDAICIRCTEKGEACRSQEYSEHPGPDEPPDANNTSAVRSVHQRLSDMEKALQAVVNAVGPRGDYINLKTTNPANYQGSVDYASAAGEDFDDFDGNGDADAEEGADEASVLDTGKMPRVPNKAAAAAPSSTVGTTPLINQQHRNVLNWWCNLPSPLDTETYRFHMYSLPPTLPRSQKLDMLRTKLLPLFPPQEDINWIFENSSGVYFVISSLFPIHSVVGSKVPAVQDMKTVPPPTIHPLCMAKKLLQLAVIVQHLEPSLDRAELSIKKPLSTLTDEWYDAVSMMVTNDDDLTGNLEGLECLLMQCLYMANIGSLRKAWIICRRAISFAQLMGLGQGVRSMVPSVDIDTDPIWKPSPAYMWYRLNFFDRYTSLLLGLPSATQDDSFARPEAVALLSPTERLERILTVASAKISERNTMRPANAREMTLRIYDQINEASKAFSPEWWALQDLSEVPLSAEALAVSLQVMVQMHYFSLVIILHLPYMMKGSTVEQREYSKNRCLCASREVLSRFSGMRRSSMSSMSCRHIDYTALVGSMTLLLSYLHHHGPSDDADIESTCEPRNTALCNPSEQRIADRNLVVATQKLLDAMARKSNDRLTAEAASIVSQLLPIIDTGLASSSAGLCRINVPYLGTVTLRTKMQTSDGEQKSPTTPSCPGSSRPQASASTQTATSVPTPVPIPEPPQPFSMMVDLRPEESILPENLNETMPGINDIRDFFSLDPSFQHFDFRGFEGHEFGTVGFGQTRGHDNDMSTTPHAHGNGRPVNGGFSLYGAPQMTAPAATAMAEQPGAAHHPGLTADAGSWAFQGVDTNYWTLLGQPFNEDLVRLMHENNEG